MRVQSNTCTNDRTDAIGVCGKCGSFLCEDCANRFVDPAFLSFRPGGLKNSLAGIGLLVGVPFLLFNFDVLGPIYDTIWGHSVFLRKGLVHSSVILGVALLLGTWIRTGDSPGVVVADSHERILCEKCYQNRKTTKLLSQLVTAIAIIVMIYGIYSVVTDGRNPNGRLFFWELRQIAAGGAIFILRDELTLLLEQFRQ